MGGRRGAAGCPPAGMPALGKGGVGHTGPGHSRAPGAEEAHRAGGARRTRLRPPRVSPTGGSGQPPRLALGPVECDVAPRTGAGRRREVVPGRHTRTYHGHRAGGGCRASRAYAGTDTRPSLPPAFLSGLVIQVGPPRAAGMPRAREHPPPSAKPAGSCSLNA